MVVVFGQGATEIKKSTETVGTDATTGYSRSEVSGEARNEAGGDGRISVSVM